MARYTFSVSPDYQNDDTVIKDVRWVQPSVEYSVELPKDTAVTSYELQYHFNMWLRSMGYVIPDDDLDN